MSFNYPTASTLYYGLDSGENNEEKSTLDELIAASKQNDPNVVEGRITYASPIKDFQYADGSKGMVQNYLLTDILGKQSKNLIYTFRVSAWNDQVTAGLLELGKYYRLSKFAWKENNYKGKLADHQCRYDINLKSASVVEHIPV